MIKQHFKVSLMLPAIYHVAHFINVRFPPGNTCFQEIIIALVSGSGKQNEKKKTQTKTPNQQTNKKPKIINQSVFGLSCILISLCIIGYILNMDFNTLPWPGNCSTFNGLKHRLPLSGYTSFADATVFPKLFPVITFLLGLPWSSPLA